MKRSKNGITGVTRLLMQIKARFPKVTKVKDATKDISIEVSPQDVSSSTKRDVGGCALAAACKRSLHVDGAIIMLSRAYIVNGHTATRYIVPPRVGRELVSFDRARKFEPGVYELEKMNPAGRIGVKRHTSGKSGGRKKRRRMHFTAGVRTRI